MVTSGNTHAVLLAGGIEIFPLMTGIYVPILTMLETSDYIMLQMQVNILTG